MKKSSNKGKMPLKMQVTVENRPTPHPKLHIEVFWNSAKFNSMRNVACDLPLILSLAGRRCTIF